MTRPFRKQISGSIGALALVFAVSLPFILSGCKSKDEGSGAPPPAKVISVSDMNLITIDQRDVAKFPIATAGQIEASAQLQATGTVFPDVSREVPVISLANGRVVDIKTRLDDNVKKGQLLIKRAEPGCHQRVQRLSQGRQRRATR